LQFEEDRILPSAKDIRSHRACMVIDGVPYPARMHFAVHIAPHLVALGAASTTHLQLIRTPYLHLHVLGIEVLQHGLMHLGEIRFLFLVVSL
jgi:hypothetical protein